MKVVKAVLKIWGAAWGITLFFLVWFSPAIVLYSLFMWLIWR